MARCGERALEALPLGVQQAERELESLVAASRSTLAETRRLIGRYKLASPRAELEQAAALVRAAGIDVRVEMPDDALPPVLDESVRGALRAAVADLLAEEPSGPVVLTLEHEEGTYALEIGRAALAEPAT